MPQIWNKGNAIKGYTIASDGPINTGSFAASYFATDKSGTEHFFKQYLNPTPQSPWFRKYQAYQDEMKKALESVKPAWAVSGILDHFIDHTGGPACYYQVIVKIQGHSLRKKLDHATEDASAFPDANRVATATLFMATVKAMHAVGIVHNDLKPDNVFLEDITGDLKYRAKVIDFDFSFLEGKEPPWSKELGYVGTEGYFSPEHMQGKIPSQASDIFTCGIMLYELLCGRGPFEGAFATIDEVKKGFKPPQSYNSDLPANVAELMHLSLSLDPAQRPKAADIHAALIGMMNPEAAKFPARIRLVGKNPAQVLPLWQAATELTRDACRVFADYNYVNERQCRLVKDASVKRWRVLPIEGVAPPNRTRVNGAVVPPEGVELNEGDTLGVGRLELTVKFGG